MAGWEPATFTRHVYAPIVWWKPWTWSRIESTISIPESEWTPEDVALLIASRMSERDYGPHGFLMSEAIDPSNAGQFVGRKAPLIDLAAKADLDAQDAYYDEWDAKYKAQGRPPMKRNGHIWGVTKKP